MTPSNPSNSQPLIYRIMDALGVTHLVACINHTHDQSEVDGLQAALLNKADASQTDTKINGKISRVPTATNGNIAEFDDDGNIKDSGKKTSDFADASATATALAGKQDALNFDTTPTANSTNPVTSGGVKAAIDDATKAVFGSMPYYITDAHEKMYVHTRILRNNTGATIKLTESIDVTALPAAERANIYWNTPDIDIPNGTEIGIRFVRASNAVFLFYDGNLEY